MAAIDMFTVEQAGRLTSLSPGRIVAWARQGFFGPAWGTAPGQPYGRLYSFRDLVGLRTLAVLRDQHHVSLADLRRVSDWLRDRCDAPWANLRFYVAGRRVYFDDPETGMRTASRPIGQGAFPFEMQAVAADVQRRVDEARKRSPEQVGQVEQHRHVVRNAPVLAGTRIPTRAIWNFHRAGYTTEQILAEYPRLAPADVAAAIAYEAERRAS